MAKNIYQVAAIFEKKLMKLANYPDQRTVSTIIERVVDSAKDSNKLLKPVRNIAAVNLQMSDNTMLVYFQLVVEPNQYEQLANEPYKSNIVSSLKPMVEQALSSTWRAFEFRVQIGITPV